VVVGRREGTGNLEVSAMNEYLNYSCSYDLVKTVGDHCDVESPAISLEHMNLNSVTEERSVWC
jgi:hypothetical protein